MVVVATTAPASLYAVTIIFSTPRSSVSFIPLRLKSLKMVPEIFAERVVVLVNNT